MSIDVRGEEQERTEEREFIDVYTSACLCTWEAKDGNNARMVRTEATVGCPEHPAATPSPGGEGK